MRICNYYRGCTDKVTGFVFDTEKKTFKRFSFTADEWWDDIRSETVEIIKSIWKPGFKMDGDLEYWFGTFGKCDAQMHCLERLGFTEDITMELDFGAFKK